MNLSVFRNPRLRLTWALMGVAVLSWVAAVVVVANYAAIPNARLIVMATLGCTFVFMATGVLAGLSRFLQNAKR